jgi:radical SAM protein with 4Fe4S-binding SPASM domain
MKINNSEVFIIPIGAKYAKNGDDINIIYSPLADICCLADQATAKQVTNMIGKDENIAELVAELWDYQLPNHQKILRQSPEKYTTLSLLPNHVCNFQCKYCYSAQGRSRTVIDRKKLQQTLDFFINPDRIEPQTLKLFISGGGEPFLTWEDTKFAIVYAQERAVQYGFTLWTSIITNGSVINDDVINTLKKYKCSVCISFEVFEDLQNDLRGHFDTVHETLIKYGLSGIPVMLNSTITPLSVCRMKDMVEKVVFAYPFVRNYTLEPVTDYTLFDSPKMLGDFYKQFSKNYLEIKKFGQIKTTIWFSLDGMLETIKLRYCPGKLCLTPHATFSICHCASSQMEERYDKCVYGKVEDDGVVFDFKKFKQLIDINVLHNDKCADCFAKWNCGGECMTRKDQYPESYMDEVCNFNRQWLITQLEERLNEQYLEDSGMSLPDIINS